MKYKKLQEKSHDDMVDFSYDTGVELYKELVNKYNSFEINSSGASMLTSLNVMLTLYFINNIPEKYSKNLIEKLMESISSILNDQYKKLKEDQNERT